MRVIGIASEYNPFHNGHKFQIEQAKEKLNADHVIACMSGNFVQRGEPALFDKWQRTEAALKNGVDIVIELPVVYALGSAEFFGRAATVILDKCGIVTDMVFGAETDDVELLLGIAKTLSSPEFKHLLEPELSKGISFPFARSNALKGINEAYAETIAYPNNILAVEYLKAIYAEKLSLAPFIVKRNGVLHDSNIVSGGFASASYIRKSFKEGDSKSIKDLMPNTSYEKLMYAKKIGLGPLYADLFSDMLMYKIRTVGKDALRAYPDVEEGLENRIFNASNEFSQISELATAIKSKRYTLTRINRILMSILLEIKKQKSFNNPQYIRVLGFKHNKSHLIKALTEKASLPVLINIKKDMNSLNSDALGLLETDFMATDIYFLKTPNPCLRTSGRDFTTPVIVI